jgi:hypothetical protein
MTIDCKYYIIFLTGNLKTIDKTFFIFLMCLILSKKAKFKFIMTANNLKLEIKLDEKSQ